MKTDQLKTTQISEEAMNWLTSKYQAVDSMNAEAYRTFLSEDCELQFGNYHLIAAEALIDYVRKDGKMVTVPCVTLIERNEDGLASSVRIFIDVAPVFG